MNAHALGNWFDNIKQVVFILPPPPHTHSHTHILIEGTHGIDAGHHWHVPSCGEGTGPSKGRHQHTKQGP